MKCPNCNLFNPPNAQRCDCGYDFLLGTVKESRPLGVGESAKGSAGRKWAILAQVVAVILATAAVVFGCLMVLVARDPGPSGEFGGYSVFFAVIVDVPVGLVSLGVGLAVKKGRPALRWACLILSAAALALPLLTKLVWQSHFIVK